MSQKQKVLKLLREQGFVSRNWALSNYISRLGAIICDLKKTMDIEAKWVENDYIYTLKDKPEIKKYYVSGELVATKTIW